MPADPKPQVAAVILAAGASSRMGQPKQLLRLGPTTLLRQTLDNVRAAQLAQIIVVLGHHAAEIQPTLEAAPDLTIVTNPDYREGLSTSLRHGLHHLHENIDAAFIVLADQPFVRPSTLSQLIAHYTHTRAPITIPIHEGKRGNPVLLARKVFPGLAALTGDVGARAVFAHYASELALVPVDDPGILLDFDKPEDLQNFQTKKQ